MFLDHLSKAVKESSDPNLGAGSTITSVMMAIVSDELPLFGSVSYIQ